MKKIVAVSIYILCSFYVNGQNGVQAFWQGGGSKLKIPTSGLMSVVSNKLLVTGYSGHCLRVRRADNNVEYDEDFSGGSLNTTQMTSDCSGTTCYVTTRYDQSGNSRNLTQTTAANQPSIDMSGNMTYSTAGTTSLKYGSYFIDDATAGSIIAWINKSSDGSSYLGEFINPIVCQLSSPDNMLGYANGSPANTPQFRIANPPVGINSSSNTSNGTWYQLTAEWNSSGSALYLNSSSVGTDATANPTWYHHSSSFPFVVGWSGNGSAYFNGNIGTIIIYSSKLSSTDISKIKTILNTAH